MELNKYQSSVVAEIQRSQIIPAPYNPRKITDKAKALIKQNFKKKGLMGGLVWNKRSGHMVAGHQRLFILDELLKYGTAECLDYTLRVEVVDLSDAEEKEQNIFLNNKNAQGEYDTGMIKAMIGDIDYKAAGLDEIDLNMIGITLDTKAQGIMDEVSDDLEKLQKPALDTKQAVKDSKAAIKEGAKTRAEDQQAFITISFDSHHSKADFLSRFGYSETEKYIKGEEFGDKIEYIGE